MDLYTLDFDDIPLDEPSRVIEVEGSEAYLGQTAALIDPKFAREVVEAPTKADLADCEKGLHSWIHEVGQLPPDTECTICGETYGNPD